MVDVRGFEPLTPCLQSRLGKTLNAFAGAAYNENHRDSRSSSVPKLYRSIRIRGPTTRTRGQARHCLLLPQGCPLDNRQGFVDLLCSNLVGLTLICSHVAAD